MTFGYSILHLTPSKLLNGNLTQDLAGLLMDQNSYLASSFCNSVGNKQLINLGPLRRDGFRHYPHSILYWSSVKFFPQ